MTTISRALTHKLEEQDPKTLKTNAMLIADVLVRNAINGNVKAAQEVADRTEGKSVDRVALKAEVQQRVERIEMVHRYMSPADASRAYQKMLKATDADVEYVMTKALALPSPKPDERERKYPPGYRRRFKQPPGTNTPQAEPDPNKVDEERWHKDRDDYSKRQPVIIDVTPTPIDDASVSPSRALAPVRSPIRSPEPQVQPRSRFDGALSKMRQAR
jgi:hypothetical protein